MCCISIGVQAWRVELSGISSKWHELGLHLGVPGQKLEEFKEKDDPLSEVIAYWLWGDKPVTWRHIVDTLRVTGEATLADKIQPNTTGEMNKVISYDYCWSHDI